MEYTFGTGLNYVDVNYDSLDLSTDIIDEHGSIIVTTTVSNNGIYPGSSFSDNAASNFSVLMFLFDEYRLVTPEYKLLKRFAKTSFSMNESFNQQWTLTANDLEYIGIDSR